MAPDAADDQVLIAELLGMNAAHIVQLQPGDYVASVVELEAGIAEPPPVAEQEESVEDVPLVDQHDTEEQQAPTSPSRAPPSTGSS